MLVWHVTETLGGGDLRLYAVTQFAALLAGVALLALLPPRHSHAGAYWLALALYLGARLAEVLDRPLYAATGALGGHTLKHLLAAAAVGALAWMLAARHGYRHGRH